jgi:hypothetical protein
MKRNRNSRKTGWLMTRPLNLIWYSSFPRLIPYGSIYEMFYRSAPYLFLEFAYEFTPHSISYLIRILLDCLWDLLLARSWDLLVPFSLGTTSLAITLSDTQASLLTGFIQYFSMSDDSCRLCPLDRNWRRMIEFKLDFRAYYQRKRSLLDRRIEWNQLVLSPLSP